MRFRTCSPCVSRHNKQQRSSKLPGPPKVFTAPGANDESSNDFSVFPGRNQSPRFHRKPRYASMMKYYDCVSQCAVKRFLEPFVQSVRQCLMTRTVARSVQIWAQYFNIGFLKTRLMISDRDQQIRMLFLTQQFRMLFLTQHVELTSHGCVRQEIASVKQNSHCDQNAR